MLTEEQRKELLAKRKYYSEHLEEAKKEIDKRDDGYIPVGIPPEDNTQVKEKAKK